MVGIYTEFIVALREHKVVCSQRLLEEGLVDGTFGPDRRP
jgi:hypothetical protein